MGYKKTSTPRSTESPGSANLFARAKQVIPGGVNSPVRACVSVGCDPVFVASGQDAHITTANGTKMVDMVGSWGPLILGHRHPAVIEAIERTLKDGVTYGAPTQNEVTFAEIVCEALPSVEILRAVSSGTEATMSALRLARGVTGRSKIVKVDGGYHGHADFLLVAAGSGAATLGLPGSAGVTQGSAQDTCIVPFNDIESARQLFAEQGDQIACVIIEPVAGNMGVVPPKPGYLEALRTLTQQYGALLIFDEVMTGFRVAYGGAQTLYNISPDITCLGKVIGGGLPAAAFGGTRAIMEHLAPIGPVYQAGTLSGNPLAMAAGTATLSHLRDNPSLYATLEKNCARIESQITNAAKAANIAITINRVGSMFTIFFGDHPVVDYATAKQCNSDQFGLFFQQMREKEFFLPPSAFEAMFVSTQHSEAICQQFVQSVIDCLHHL